MLTSTVSERIERPIFPDFHFAAQAAGQLRLERRPNAVHIDNKGKESDQCRG